MISPEYTTVSGEEITLKELEATVFVIDDDIAVCKSLRWLIESVHLHVITFSSAKEFLDNYQPEQPGCAVLDVRMPGMSGLDLLERLAHENIFLPVIVVTGHGDVAMAVRAMKAGATDFFEKPFKDQILLDTVQQAIEKDRHTRHKRARHEKIAGRIKLLTPREREVMDCVVRGKPNREIAVELNVSSKTVEAHRIKIMEKMQANSLAELVRAVLCQ